MLKRIDVEGRRRSGGGATFAADDSGFISLSSAGKLSRRLILHKRRWFLLVIIILGYGAFQLRPVDPFRPYNEKLAGLSRISASPIAVHHDPALLDYSNTPVSVHRPALDQFTRNIHVRLPEPMVIIITAAQNSRPVMLETIASLQHQSLQNWEWVIVDDHTDDEESLALLEEVALDPRVTLLKNDGPRGLSTARNVGLEYALGKRVIPPYFVCLDDDDLFELTALEKAVWSLESNGKEWDMVGFPFVKFAAQNTTESRGFHSGKDNYAVGNFIANSAVFKASVLIDSGCRYNVNDFSSGGEDWDLWMCFAAAGFWGGQIPEFLYWYRVNDSSFRQLRWGSTFVDGFATLHAKIKAAHPSLEKGLFPAALPRRSNQLEPILWEPPFKSILSQEGRAIMFVVPWLYVGGADIGAMRMIQLYAEAGYRVTVVCTLYKNPDGLELRPFILQLTHDVHVLPSFLRVNDFPRYIKYLIESRGISDVILSNSAYMYETLPALAEKLPHVKFTDYLHNESHDGWKSGGYPIYSIISQRYLARTITCSAYLRRWAIARGHAAERIGVVKLGIELSDFVPTNQFTRNAAKRSLLNVSPDVMIITVVARMDPQKRSQLVPLIADELRQMGNRDFIILMLGGGDLTPIVKASVEAHKLEGHVKILGTISSPADYLAATDIFLLPSLLEGISVATAEAMAMGLPIVTARAGALPEQLGDDSDVNDPNRSPSGGSSATTTTATGSILAGVLVNHTLIDAVDAVLYAQELHTLMHSPTLRKTYGDNGLALTQTFSWRSTLAGLFPELKKASNLDQRDLKKMSALPNPAAYYSGQSLVMQAYGETELAAHYPW